MAIAKVVDRLGNTLIDLTGDSVTPNKVLAGTSFHDKNGNLRTGILTSPQSAYFDKSKYNFIDYDGTLMYSFTDEEIDMMSELPQPSIDHTEDNLTFQEWNWNLDDLKSWDRTRPDRPIVGANYTTTDGYTYMYLDLPAGNKTLSMYFNYYEGTEEIDWGDGTTTTIRSTTINHTYISAGSYTIKIKGSWNTRLSFSSTSSDGTTAKQYIRHIRLGNITLEGNGFCNLYHLETISLSNNAAYELTYAYGMFRKCFHLIAVVIPRYITGTSNTDYFFDNNFDIETISFSKNIHSIGRNFAYYCFSLKNIVLPSNITAINGQSFAYDYSLKNIVIPNNTTLSGSNIFQYCYFLTLDLSHIDKVLSISSSSTIQIPGNYQDYGIYSTEILVPNDLLSAYENDSVWYYYKGYIKGV